LEFQSITTGTGRLWSSLRERALASYVRSQLERSFPDGIVLPADIIEGAVANALGSVARSSRQVALASYTTDGEPKFSHLHSDQYASFLAFLAAELSRAGHGDLATRVYLLNKALHGLDIYHEVALPEIFLLVHPVGTVIGRARLGNFLCIYQNCSIGGNPKAKVIDYPTFGEGVLMFAKSAVIGRSTVGSRVVLGADSLILNSDVPDDSMATRRGIKPSPADVREQLSRLFTGF
jgi:serine O-acetyltransferase